jgi:hypothetical protein
LHTVSGRVLSGQPSGRPFRRKVGRSVGRSRRSRRREPTSYACTRSSCWPATRSVD